MSTKLTEIAKKQGRVPALITALGVLAWMVFVSVVGYLLQLVGPGGLEGTNFWYTFKGLLLESVPFALGVFVSLWAIAPISHQLTLPFVLTRGALATAAGSVLAFVVAVFIGIFGAFQPGTTVFGNSFPYSSFDGGYFVSMIYGTIQGLILRFLYDLPVVLLAVVLLWLWLKAHPREYPISGLIDEV